MFKSKEDVKSDDYIDRSRLVSSKNAPVLSPPGRERFIGRDKAHTYENSSHASNTHPDVSLFSAPPSPSRKKDSQEQQDIVKDGKKRKSMRLFGDERHETALRDKFHVYENSWHASEASTPSLSPRRKNIAELPIEDETRIFDENIQRQQRIIDEQRGGFFKSIASRWKNKENMELQQPKQQPRSKTHYWNPQQQCFIQYQPMPLYINEYPALAHHYYQEMKSTFPNQLDLTSPIDGYYAKKQEEGVSDEKYLSQPRHHDYHQPLSSTFFNSNSPRDSPEDYSVWKQQYDDWQQEFNTLPLTDRINYKFNAVKNALLLNPSAIDELKGITTEQYGHYKDLLRNRINDGKSLLHDFQHELENTEHTAEDVKDMTVDKFNEYKNEMYNKLSSIIDESNTQQRDLSQWLHKHHLRPKDIVKTGKNIAHDAQNYVEDSVKDAKHLLHDAQDYVETVVDNPQQLVKDGKRVLKETKTYAQDLIDDNVPTTQDELIDQSKHIVRNVKKQLNQVQNWWDDVDLQDNETVHQTVDFIKENKVPIGIGLATLAAGAVAYNAFSHHDSPTSSSDTDTSPNKSMLTTGILGLSQGALTAAFVDMFKDQIEHMDVDELWKSKKVPQWVKDSLSEDQFRSIFQTIKQNLPQINKNDTIGENLQNIKKDVVDKTKEGLDYVTKKGGIDGDSVRDNLNKAKDVITTGVKKGGLDGDSVRDNLNKAKDAISTSAKDVVKDMNQVKDNVSKNISDNSDDSGGIQLAGLIKGGLAALLSTTALQIGKDQLNHMNPTEAYHSLPDKITQNITQKEFTALVTMLKDYSNGRISPETREFVDDVKSEAIHRTKEGLVKGREMLKDGTVTNKIENVKDSIVDVKDTLVDAYRGDIDINTTVEHLAGTLLTPELKEKLTDLANEYNFNPASLQQLFHNFSTMSSSELVDSTKQVYVQMKDELIDKLKEKVSSGDLAELATALASSSIAMVPFQNWCKKHNIDPQRVASQLSTETQNWLTQGSFNDATKKTSWQHAGTPMDLVHNATEGVKFYKNKMNLETQYQHTVDEFEGLWKDILELINTSSDNVNLTQEQRIMLHKLEQDYALFKIHCNQYCDTPTGRKYNHLDTTSSSFTRNKDRANFDSGSIPWPKFQEFTQSVTPSSTPSKSPHNNISMTTLMNDSSAIYKDIATFAHTFNTEDMKDSILTPVIDKIKVQFNNDQDDNKQSSSFLRLFNALSASPSSEDSSRRIRTGKDQRQQQVLASLHTSPFLLYSSQASSPSTFIMMNTISVNTDSDTDYPAQSPQQASLTDNEDSTSIFETASFWSVSPSSLSKYSYSSATLSNSPSTAPSDNFSNFCPTDCESTSDHDDVFSMHSNF